ncbi:MAG: hypothetical protein ABSF58_05720 [Solirubrobacteraceae bacterium]|jgi:hypothetical protein
MRGHEQHVERKIRLWVVQQERNRLREVQPQRLDAQANERTEQRRTDADAQARERWRLP